MTMLVEQIEITLTDSKAPLLTFLDWLDRYISHIYSSTQPFTTWRVGDYSVNRMVFSSSGGKIPISVKQENGWKKVQVNVTIHQSDAKLILDLEYPDELIDFIMHLKIEIDKKFSQAPPVTDNYTIPNIPLEKICATIPDYNYDRTVVLLWLMGYTAEAIGLFVNMGRDSVLNRLSQLRSKYHDVVITDDERKRRGIPKKG